MLILVTGASGSGKSAIAERCAVELHEKKKSIGTSKQSLYYLATMRSDPSDGETMQRIARHRELRKGKGFETIECPGDLGSLAKKMKPGVYLLEDLPNLLANELFGGSLSFNTSFAGGVSPEALGSEPCCREISVSNLLLSETEEVIVQPLLLLAERGDLVVVTGELDCDGIQYDPAVQQFLQLLGHIGQILAGRAEYVVESVFGIAVPVKGDCRSIYCPV